MGLFHKHKERAALEDLHICFVCDAGMGSSAMAAGQLQKKLKAHGISCRVKNCAIDEVAPDAEILISHQNFAQRIQKQFPTVRYYSVQGFMNDEEYENFSVAFLPRLHTGDLAGAFNSAVCRRQPCIAV